MDSIILPPSSLHSGVDTVHALPEKIDRSTRPRLTSFSTTRDNSISWGRRHHHGSWAHTLSCLGIMVLCPTLVIFLWISLSSFDGSFSAAYNSMAEHGPVRFFMHFAPKPNGTTSLGYVAWLLFQVALYQFLPSELSSGQLTPAGNLLKYRTNGLFAWFVTHTLFAVSALFGLINPAIIANNWQGLLVAANVFGFALSGLAYGKAILAPTHAGDRKFSGMCFDLIATSQADQDRIYHV